MSRILDTIRESLSWGERTPRPHFHRGPTRAQLLKQLLEREGAHTPPKVVQPAPPRRPPVTPLVLPKFVFPETPDPF